MIATDIKTKIPEGWQQNKLSYFTNLAGKRYPKNTMPYLEIGDVDIISKSYRLKEKPAPGICLAVEYGDVLISKVRPTRGAIVLVKDNLYTSPAFSVLRANNSKEYLFYALSRQNFVNYLGIRETGTTYPSCDDNDILDYKIVFPESPKEQQKIAEVLTTIDEAIEKTDAIIEKNKRIQQGLMQDLFRYGIDEHGNIRSEKTHKFKTVRIGNEEIKIPEEWGWDAIVNNLEIVDYRGKSPTKVDDGIFLVTARNIKNGIIDYSLSQEFVPASEYSKIMSRGKAKLGDVLFTTEAPMGEVANIDNENIALAQRIIKFDGTRKNINNYYLKYLLTSEPLRKQLFSDSTGSTVTGIKGSRLKKIFILIPKREEQDKINNLLQSQDFKMKKEQTYKQKLLSLKRGLMEDLLTGKVRVNSLIN